MKYTIMLFSFILFFSSPSIASEQQKMMTWDEVTANWDQVKNRVLNHPVTTSDAINNYRTSQFYPHHKMAVQWFKELDRKNEIHNFANNYINKHGVRRPVSIWHKGKWGTSINSYEKVINTCEIKKIGVPCDYDWQKYTGRSGKLEKQTNSSLTYLSTAFIAVILGKDKKGK